MSFRSSSHHTSSRHHIFLYAAVILCIVSLSLGLGCYDVYNRTILVILL